MFSRGSVRIFHVHLQSSLGGLQILRVWHDNSGSDPSWFLRQFVIRDFSNNSKKFFLSDQWFAVDQDDGKVDRVIHVASAEQLSSFKNIFYSKTTRNISDGHLWLSVVMKPSNSTFSRVQRLTCCLTVLLTAMITNAMYYQFDTSAVNTEESTIVFGPFVINLKQIMIGIQSSVVIVPINFIIMFIFKNTQPAAVSESCKIQKQVAKYEAKEENEGTNSRESSKVKFLLPYWFIYIAYILSACACVAAAFFTVLYSIQWGEEKSNQWLASVTVSLLQDIVFVQPIKIVVLALIFALLIRHPAEDDDLKETEISGESSYNKTSELSSGPKKLLTSEMASILFPPTSEELVEARKLANKRRYMRHVMKELFFQVVFVWCFAVVCYGNRSSERYHVTKVFYDTFKYTHKVKNAATFWNWVETIFLPGLYDTTWYNGKNFTSENDFIGNKKYMMVGIPRIKQIRVREEPCHELKDQPALQKWFPSCFYAYSSNTVDNTVIAKQINQGGKLTLNDSQLNSALGFDRICLQPMMFQSAFDLGTLSVIVGWSAFDGGGYVSDLGYDLKTARDVVYNLKEDNWIDRHTRAIIVETVVFEPATNLFAHIRYIFDYQPSGSIEHFHRVEPVSFYGSQSKSLEKLNTICTVFLAVLILFKLGQIIWRFCKEKWHFCKSFWNCLDMLLILAAITTSILMAFNSEYTRQMVLKVQQNPYARMSFDYVVRFNDLESSAFSVIAFLITIKLLRLLKFNTSIMTFTHCVRCSKNFLLSFASIFFCVLMAYAQVGVLIFGQTEGSYKSILSALTTELSIILGGKMGYNNLNSIGHVMGPLFLFSFSLINTILLMNFFITVLNESLVEAKNIDPEDDMDAQLSDFMEGELKRFLKDIGLELKTLIKSNKKRNSKFKHSNERAPKDSDFFLY